MVMKSGYEIASVLTKEFSGRRFVDRMSGKEGSILGVSYRPPNMYLQTELDDGKKTELSPEQKCF